MKLHVVTADVHHGLRNGCTCRTCKDDMSRIVAFRAHYGLRNGCTCPTCKTDMATIVARRVHCTACDGNADRCRDGQGETHDHARLDGCNAFTDNGKIRPKRARKAPAQPWEPKKAA